MRMRLFQWIEKWPKWIVLTVSLVSLAAIGLADYLTGTEISFTLFYLIPVVVLAWTIDRRAGFMASALCAVVWAGVDFFGRAEPNLVYTLWNISIQFGVFLAFADAISRLRAGIVEQRHLNKELQAALAEVKALSGLLPICAWCRKIRDERGSWIQLEQYVVSHSEAEFTHSICPDCSRRVKLGG